jgi:hypothetical protein
MTNPKFGTPVNPKDLPSTPLSQTGIKPMVGPGQGNVVATSSVTDSVDPSAYLDFVPPAISGSTLKAKEEGDEKQEIVSAPLVESPRVTTVARRIESKESKTLHALRQKFGVASIKKDLFVFKLDEDFSFSFRRKRGGFEQSWYAAKVASMNLGDKEEQDDVRTLNFLIATVSIHLSAINDVPLYAHFDLDVSGTTIHDPYNPPLKVKLIGADYLVDYFSDPALEDLVVQLGNAFLAEVNSDQIDTDGSGGSEAAPLDPQNPSPLLKKKILIFISGIFWPGRCAPQYMIHASWPVQACMKWKCLC